MWESTSRHERGYGSAWVKLRAWVKRRDRGLCQPCLRVGRYTAMSAVDHIVPKSSGGTDTAENLECICDACHRAKTQAEAAAAQGKRLRPKAAFDRSGRVIWPG